MDARPQEIEWQIDHSPSVDKMMDAIIAVCSLDRQDSIKYALLAELCDILIKINRPPTYRETHNG
jgi:hypothetical protein